MRDDETIQNRLAANCFGRNDMNAVIRPPRIIIEVERVVDAGVIAKQVTAEHRVIALDVPRIRVNAKQAGIATGQGHAVGQMKRRLPVARLDAHPSVRSVNPLRHADLIRAANLGD